MKIDIDKLEVQFYENCTTYHGDFYSFKKNPFQLWNWIKQIFFQDKISNKQRRALHLYFKMIAEQFTNLGWTFHYVNPFLGDIIELPWTGELIKEYIWKPIQIELFGKNSTMSLKTEEINKIIDILSMHFGNNGFEIEFPNWQSFMNKLEKEYLDKLNGEIV